PGGGVIRAIKGGSRVSAEHSPSDIVEATALTRVYRSGPAEVRALDGVDLQVRHGEFLALVGVSGCGKSTLLHLMGGLVPPTSVRSLGKCRELGSLRSYERALYRRQQVGFVFQSFHLVPSMTAAANVGLALTFQGTYGEERRLRTADALKRVGLDHRAGHRP